MDSIKDLEGLTTESLGGPVCYGALLAKTFNLSVNTASRVGYDIGDKMDSLKFYNIKIKQEQIDMYNPTTKFRLELNKDGSRTLTLLAKCSKISFQDFEQDIDGVILSPVIDEIPSDIVQHLRNKDKNKLIMVDPQGFLRRINSSDGSIYLDSNIDLNMNGVTGVKVDEDELKALTKGITSIEGMKFLQKKYKLEFVISTGRNSILFLNKNILYSLSFKKLNSPDYTGLGDILTTGFSCSFLKEKDPLWAICFGAGSVIAALESKKKGIQKVPRAMKLVERNASYFYNTIKFRIID